MNFWIILLAIAILAFYFFIKRSNKGEEEYVLPSDHNSIRQETDLEIAKESATTKINIKNKKDFEASTELAIKDRPKIIELDNNIPATQKIHIGGKIERVPAHEIPINLDLDPTLIVLAKDPYWLFVYWVLPADSPTGEWTLKVINLTQQTEFFQSIDPGARRWYLHLNQPDQNFTCELGVRDENGVFHPILFSNEVHTPPDQPSNVVDVDWMAIDEFYQKKVIISPEGSPEFIFEFAEKGGASDINNPSGSFQ